MILGVVFAAIVLLSLGYMYYSRFLARAVQLDDKNVTPACTINDGVDYVPAGKSLLLGQHFSAIAAAGPIVGPILAAIWFGWLPTLIWIILGSIFVGGTHDFLSLVASVRHRATSMGEIVRQYMSRRSQILFLIFIWFALVYVIIAFTDVIAQTFKSVTNSNAFGPGVAVSSFLYLIVGLAMGVTLYRKMFSLKTATSIFLPMVIVAIWVGTVIPESLSNTLIQIPVKTWEIIILAYCFVASLLPMWLLLQPRGYLGGWFLYLTVFVALFGAFFGGYTIQYPAVHLDGLTSIANGKPLLPILFITVACGACSGFHAIVSGGTTSKQIKKETDTRPVGYGSMILEGVVAVLALATVMILPKGSPLLSESPNMIYAKGLAKYMGLLKINFQFALAFALLAFSTFVYDTLDVCTRLARYIIQEIMGWRSFISAVIATTISLALPLVFLMVAQERAYLAAWPVFGTINQLLAALTLLAISVWLMKTGRPAFFTIIPMIFMLTVTLWSLMLQIIAFLKRSPQILDGSLQKPDLIISGLCSLILLVLSINLIYEAIVAMRLARQKH